MSTNVNTEAIPSQSVDSEAGCSFSELVKRLNIQTSPPSLEDLQSWLTNVEITPDDLKPYVAFKEANYWRHRVCRNSAVEMLVLCWRPGHKTPIHDHNGSVGAVRVQAGLLSETMFRYDEVKGLGLESEREWNVGGVTGADLPDIHQLGNRVNSGQDLITIHIYAPPLSVIKTYKLGSSEIDLYTPDDSGA